MRKICLTLFLIAFLLSTANAQKLPNIQTASLRAPANIKIDGKVTEWSNQFQAYNHATDIFYTVSNDDSKLYLTIHATDKQVMNKILRGGVTFTVQCSGKKTDKGGISVTYPLFDQKSTPDVPPVFNVRMGPGVMIHLTPGMSDGLEKLKESQRDSVITEYNKKLDFCKYIGVTGVKGLDALISVYNTDGIKAAQRFDNKMYYTFELGIDLKLLGLRAADGSKFAYRIAVNPFSTVNVPDLHPSKLTADSVRMPPGGSATTDMWGEYTLAKQ